MQPIVILPQDSTRTTGREAQRMNIQAAKLVAEAVRSTLGPKGMDKMLVDAQGDVTVTNDGVTILEEMQVEQPCAKMLVEIAKTQENEVGDGTTTAVVLAGELLKSAESLLEEGIHPTVVARGYRIAAEHAQEVLKNIAKNCDANDDDLLQKIALTAMTGKGVEEAKELLAKLVVRAAKTIGGGFERQDVKVEKASGGQLSDTELINGILLEKERLSTSMPEKVSQAKIALLDTPLEIRNTEIDAKINITDPQKLQAFLDMEEEMLRTMVGKVSAVGVNVLFCQKGIDDLAVHFLAKRGIYASRRVKKSDMERLEKATGATVITNIDDLTTADLGSAGVVENIRVGEEKMTFVKECPAAKAVTILVRGGTDHVISEAQRAIEDAVGDVASAINAGKVVAGAGAPEIEVSLALEKFATTLSGREQLAAKVFADAIEIIPKTLAENAGLDPIDALTELKAAHNAGQTWAGVDVFTGKTLDAWNSGVIEPLQIKTQAFASASEVAVMILRIDDVIAGQQEPSNV